ncbi:MAG: hypothetical protein ACI3XG_06680 [Faecousia sp.]
MEKWENLESLGLLSVEIELVVANEPLLFVCMDESEKNRYLVMTYDSLEEEYVLAKTTPAVLIRMLNNQITMEQAFRSAPAIYATVGRKNGQLLCRKYDPSLFSPEKLPEAGAFFNIHSDYILRYLHRLQSDQIPIAFSRVRASGSIAIPSEKADVSYAYGSDFRRQKRSNPIRYELTEERAALYYQPSDSIFRFAS